MLRQIIKGGLRPRQTFFFVNANLFFEALASYYAAA